MNMNMKSILVLLTMFGGQCSCASSTKEAFNIEEYINVNEYFYKGGTGVMGNGLYVRKFDKNYVLYFKSGYGGDVIFEASPGVEEVVILRVDVKGDQADVERVETINRESKDFFVVFSKKAVYFLDFSSKRYGKYLRP